MFLWLICSGADKCLAHLLIDVFFDGENISFDASPFMYTDSNKVPPIMIINRT